MSFVAGDIDEAVAAADADVERDSGVLDKARWSEADFYGAMFFEQTWTLQVVLSLAVHLVAWWKRSAASILGRFEVGGRAS